MNGEDVKKHLRDLAIVQEMLLSNENVNYSEVREGKETRIKKLINILVIYVEVTKKTYKEKKKKGKEGEEKI
jgi:hypothetical protein